jgi:hypothetical protein
VEFFAFFWCEFFGFEETHHLHFSGAVSFSCVSFVLMASATNSVTLLYPRSLLRLTKTLTLTYKPDGTFTEQ